MITFVTLTEISDTGIWYRFLQLDGNEDVINGLKVRLMGEAKTDYGQGSIFQLDLKNKVSEKDAITYCNTNINPERPHKILTGIMTTIECCPLTDLENGGIEKFFNPYWTPGTFAQGQKMRETALELKTAFDTLEVEFTRWAHNVGGYKYEPSPTAQKIHTLIESLQEATA